MLEFRRREDGLTAGAAARKELARIPPGPHLQELPPEDILQSLRQKLRFRPKKRAPEGLLPPSLQGGVAI